jgi:hypothetical protein
MIQICTIAVPIASMPPHRLAARQPTMAGDRLAEDLVFNILSCLTAAFLCMMFGTAPFSQQSKTDPQAAA